MLERLAMNASALHALAHFVFIGCVSKVHLSWLNPALNDVLFDSAFRLHAENHNFAPAWNFFVKTQPAFVDISGVSCCKLRRVHIVSHAGSTPSFFAAVIAPSFAAR